MRTVLQVLIGIIVILIMLLYHSYLIVHGEPLIVIVSMSLMITSKSLIRLVNIHFKYMLLLVE